MDTDFSKRAHAVVTPSSVEEESIDKYNYLENNHSSIPLPVKTLAWTWIYKKSHDFCKYTPVDEIPDMLCRFETDTTKDGREFRFPIFKKVNGNTTSIYEFMEFESKCRVHWQCQLCGLPMCVNPEAYVAKEVVACTPVQSKDLAKVSTYCSQVEYMWHYLMKDHVDLEMDDIDTISLKNRFRNYDYGGFWGVFWEEVHSHKNSQEIVNILKQKLNLTE